jgi:hypothetical protein
MSRHGLKFLAAIFCYVPLENLICILQSNLATRLTFYSIPKVYSFLKKFARCFFNEFFLFKILKIIKWVHMYVLPWRLGLVVTSPLTTEEIGAMGREIESRQGIHRVKGL